MMHKLRWLPLAALTLMLGTVMPAIAGGVGMLDMPAIMKDYKGTAMASTAMELFYNQAIIPYRIASDAVGLAKDDFETYKKLKEKAVADQEAIAKLEMTSRQNSERYFSLRDKGKKALSAEDGQEYEQLFRQSIQMQGMAMVDDRTQAELNNMSQRYQELEKKAKAALTAEEVKDYDRLQAIIIANSVEKMRIGRDLQTQLDDEQQRYQQIFTAEFDKAVAKVAKEQKLSVIISKNIQVGQGAEEKLVLWADENADITKKVVDALNANFKPELLIKKTTPPVGPVNR